MNNSLKILINVCDKAFSRGDLARFVRLRKKVIDQTRFFKGEYLKKDISSGNVKRLHVYGMSLAPSGSALRSRVYVIFLCMN